MPRHTIIPTRVLIVISTVVVALVLLLASSVQARPEATDTADYRVRSGDNLWQIAESHTTSGDDVRNTIESIKRLNDLSSSMLRPGQVLAVPVASR